MQDDESQNNSHAEDGFRLSRSSSKKCFTLVQQRRFWALPLPDTIVALCPSMDLIAYGLPPSNNSNTHNNNNAALPQQQQLLLQIYRTLHWQKIAQITAISNINPSNDLDITPPINKLTPQTPPLKTASTSTTTSTSRTSLSLTGTWHPDGRSLAVAEGSSVSLYSLEGMLKSDHSHSGGINSEDDPDTPPGKVFCLTSSGNGRPMHSVTALSWHHAGRPHPAWQADADTDDDDDAATNELFWTYRARFYMNRERSVLPPSDYHGISNNDICNPNEHSEQSHPMDDMPTCPTPLNVLTVSCANANELHLFLLGRFPLVTIRNVPGSNHRVLATSDLKHYIVVDADTYQLHIYSVPTLARHRYEWQTLSTLYCKLVLHLTTARQKVPELAAAYKSSLKAVDLKIDNLRALLANYGLLNVGSMSPKQPQQQHAKDPDAASSKKLRALLVQYILSGHTRTAPNLSNAVDQFFTGVQMNDQLIQRMDRTLQGGMANVEILLQRELLAPAQAIAYEVAQLHGLALTLPPQDSLSSSPPRLVSSNATGQLLAAAHELLRHVETAQQSLVEARVRLTDWIAWLRSVGATIKARGTAPQSVQRQHATQRRVSDAVTDRMLQYLLSSPPASESTTVDENRPPDASVATSSNIITLGTTERVLGLKFATYLGSCSHHGGPELPPESSAGHHPHETTTVAAAIDRVTHLVHHPVFGQTQSSCVVPLTRVILDSNNEVLPPSPTHRSADRRILAATVRVGQGGIDVDTVAFGEVAPEGYFNPRPLHDPTITNKIVPANQVRQWCVTALAATGQNLQHHVQLHALALTWTSPTTACYVDDDNDDDDNDSSHVAMATECYWTVSLQLPSKDDYTVHDLAFYGDDGKSSLSSGLDSGTGQEGRQSLGMLVSRRKHRGSEDDESMEQADAPEDSTIAISNEKKSEQLELWMVPYDHLLYGGIDLGVVSDSNEDTFSCALHASDELIPVFTVQPWPESSGNENPHSVPMDLPNRIVYARTRTIVETMDFSARGVDDDDHTDAECRLVLSGSRGMGAALTKQQGGTMLEIFDLEDDEEEEEEGDEAEAMDAERDDGDEEDM